MVVITTKYDCTCVNDSLDQNSTTAKEEEGRKGNGLSDPRLEMALIKYVIRICSQ